MSELGKHITPVDRFQPTPCRSCGRSIIWAVTKTGASIPLDARPAQAHIYAVTDRASGELAAINIRPLLAKPEGEPGLYRDLEVDRVFVSHFLTCPNPPRRS